MEQRFIMTAFGKDRPGIVADVVEVIYNNGCNLEDSTMTLLSNQFTLILVFEGSGDDLEKHLKNDCRHLEVEKGLSVFIRPLEADPPVTEKDFKTRSIQVEGLDKAGIVYNVARFFADMGINIDDLRSQKFNSPESGTPMYKMQIHIQIPLDVSLDRLDAGLSEIADELNVDISFD